MPATVPVGASGQAALFREGLTRVYHDDYTSTGLLDNALGVR